MIVELLSDKHQGALYWNLHHITMNYALSWCTAEIIVNKA